MNKLIGRIVRIESSQQMSIVDINVDEDIFSSIVLETPETASYLKVGGTVSILFKETEVSLAKNLTGKISLRNRFKAHIKSIEESALLSKIILDYQDVLICSVITTRAVKNLDLKVGDHVEWLVKTNEVSLAQGD